MNRNKPPELRPIFWAYGFASVSFGIKNNAFSYLLLPFLTQVLGMPGYVAATALFVALLWDAVSDLLLGHWSDKTSSRLGRRHPFMYAALIFMPLSFWGLFNPMSEMSETATFWYVVVFAILIRTATTLQEVPSLAQLPELESDYEKRGRWLSIRHFFGWMGGNGIHTVNFFLWVGHYGLSVHTGYVIYSYVGATLIAISILVSALGTQRYFAGLPRPAKTIQGATLWEELQSACRELVNSLRNLNFAVLFFNGLLTGVAGGLLAGLYLYNTTYFFGFNGTQIAMTGVFVLASPLIASGLIPILGRTYSKRHLAIAAIALFIVLTPIPYVLFLVGYWPAMGSWTSLFLYSAFIVADVVLLIINGVMLDSMMADVVEDSEIDTDRRAEGLFYATRGFISKATSAGGVLFAGTIVTIVGMEGFETATDMNYDHRVTLTALFAPIYCGLQLFAAILVWFYKIERSTHASNLETLAHRHKQVAEGAL